MAKSDEMRFGLETAEEKRARKGQYRQQFTDPISISQFYFTRDVWDIMNEFCKTEQEISDFIMLIAEYALENTINEELARSTTIATVDAFNRAAALLQIGLNKYRWDVYNGRKGGRPKGDLFLPQITRDRHVKR